MDTARKADAPIVIRSAEPSDAAAISALIGMPGTFENLLQVADAPVASRLEFLQKIDPQGCRLVAVAGDEIVGNAGLFAQHTTLRRMHARGLGISVHPEWQGRGVGRKLMARLLDWADNWANVLRIELHVHADNERLARLNLIRGVLCRLEYEGKRHHVVQPDPDIAFNFSPDCISGERLAL